MSPVYERHGKVCGLLAVGLAAGGLGTLRPVESRKEGSTDRGTRVTTRGLDPTQPHPTPLAQAWAMGAGSEADGCGGPWKNRQNGGSMLTLFLDNAVLACDTCS